MNKKTDKKTALLDVEIILYRHAAKAETEGTNLLTLKSMCRQAIDQCVMGCKASEFYLVVSGRNNFRKTLYPNYKGNRGAKPPLYTPLSKAMKEMYAERWYQHDQLEADDLLGIISTNGKIEKPIICSIDKDMLSVPGWHYNWDKDDWPTYVSQEEADHNWLVQLLMGDSTDCIEGMKGIGKVKAEKLIKKYKNPELSVPEQAKYIYEKEGFSLDQYYACLNTVTIWRKPLPEALLDNELITEIVKTIPTLE